MWGSWDLDQRHTAPDRVHLHRSDEDQRQLDDNQGESTSGYKKNFGQKKNFGDRVTSITLEKIRFVSVYQPLWSNGPENIDQYRHFLESELARTPMSLALVIGGDHNAHIGREERGPANGKYGLTTPSTIAGEDLIDWFKTNEMQWVNSFFNIKKRGTWFNESHKRWYELDGFVMRKDERHKLCKSMKVTDDNALSDHQPITLTIRTTSKNNRLARTQRKPNLNWEALNVQQKALEFLERTEVLSTTLSEDCSWKDISEIMEKAVREICGIKKRHVANPWTRGHEEELESLHEKIAEAVRCRNEDTEVGRNSKWAKDQLKVARRNMKNCLTDLERAWWDNILNECRDANEKGDMGSMFRLLRQLGGRDSKPNSGTTITTDEFKTHFQQVSSQRYENMPEELMTWVRKMGDWRNDPRHVEADKKLNETPSPHEIEECMKDMKDSAPGADNVRIKYIKLSSQSTKNHVVRIVTESFEKRAPTWNEALKVGQIVPLHKKGDRNDTNNYRGVCLLAMGSRILAKVLSKRLRQWSEKLGLLDENQSGFRPGRSTTDATQVIIRMKEDADDLRKRREQQNLPIEESTDPTATLLDLRKAYPRVNKPALWEMLRRYGMDGSFLNSLMDLHEATKYRVKGMEGESDEWTPERGLREGCSTSPCLFNIFHQVVMRIAEIEKRTQ